MSGRPCRAASCRQGGAGRILCIGIEAVCQQPLSHRYVSMEPDNLVHQRIIPDDAVNISPCGKQSLHTSVLFRFYGRRYGTLIVIRAGIRRHAHFQQRIHHAQLVLLHCRAKKLRYPQLMFSQDGAGLHQLLHAAKTLCCRDFSFHGRCRALQRGSEIGDGIHICPGFQQQGDAFVAHMKCCFMQRRAIERITRIHSRPMLQQ